MAIEAKLFDHVAENRMMMQQATLAQTRSSTKLSSEESAEISISSRHQKPDAFVSKRHKNKRENSDTETTEAARPEAELHAQEQFDHDQLAKALQDEDFSIQSIEFDHAIEATIEILDHFSQY